MARFIINNKVYDTQKIKLIGTVKKWYEFRSYFSRQFLGEGVGRLYNCELYCSPKGNWLLTHEGDTGLMGEAISESEAKRLLMQHDYDAYVKKYGSLEEA